MHCVVFNRSSKDAERYKAKSQSIKLPTHKKINSEIPIQNQTRITNQTTHNTLTKISTNTPLESLTENT